MSSQRSIDWISQHFRSLVEAEKVEEAVLHLSNSLSLIKKYASTPQVAAMFELGRKHTLYHLIISTHVENYNPVINAAVCVSASLVENANHALVQAATKVKPYSFLLVLVFLLALGEANTSNVNSKQLNMSLRMASHTLSDHTSPSEGIGDLQEKLNQIDSVDLLTFSVDNKICQRQGEVFLPPYRDNTVHTVTEHLYVYSQNENCFFMYTQKTLDRMAEFHSKLALALAHDQKEPNIVPSYDPRTDSSNCYFYGNGHWSEETILRDFKITSSSAVFLCQAHCQTDNRCLAWTFNFLSQSCYLLTTDTVHLNRGHAITSSRYCQLQTGLGIEIPTGCNFKDVKIENLLFKCPQMDQEVNIMKKAIQENILNKLSFNEIFNLQQSHFIENMKQIIGNKAEINLGDVNYFQSMAHQSLLMPDSFSFHQTLRDWPEIKQRKQFYDLLISIKNHTMGYWCGENVVCYVENSYRHVISLRKDLIEKEITVTFNPIWMMEICSQDKKSCVKTEMTPAAPVPGLLLSDVTIGDEMVSVILITSEELTINSPDSSLSQTILAPAALVVNRCQEIQFKKMIIRSSDLQTMCTIPNSILGRNSSVNLIQGNLDPEVVSEVIQYLILVGMGLSLAIIRCCCQGPPGQPTGLQDTTEASWEAQETLNEPLDLDKYKVPIPPCSVNQHNSLMADNGDDSIISIN